MNHCPLLQMSTVKPTLSSPHPHFLQLLPDSWTPGLLPHRISPGPNRILCHARGTWCRADTRHFLVVFTSRSRQTQLKHQHAHVPASPRCQVGSHLSDGSRRDRGGLFFWFVLGSPGGKDSKHHGFDGLYMASLMTQTETRCFRFFFRSLIGSDWPHFGSLAGTLKFRHELKLEEMGFTWFYQTSISFIKYFRRQNQAHPCFVLEGQGSGSNEDPRGRRPPSELHCIGMHWQALAWHWQAWGCRNELRVSRECARTSHELCMAVPSFNMGSLGTLSQRRDRRDQQSLMQVVQHLCAGRANNSIHQQTNMSGCTNYLRTLHSEFVRILGLINCIPTSL